MAYLNSNEPYGRQSEGNGAINPALLGMVAGGAASGAFVGQSKMSYNNVPKKAERMIGKLDNRIDASNDRITREKKSVARKMDRLDRRDAKEEKYTKAMDKYKKKVEPHRQNIDQLNTEKGNVNSSKMQEAHRYHKMGGWKNAGIVAGTALAGTAAGYVTDKLID